jgi:TusA-related sulfurtransferase
MAVEKLDTTYLHRTSAILKIAGKLVSMKKGDVLEVIGSSLTFAGDVEEWCKRYNKKYSFHIDPETNAVKCRIHI